MCVCVFPWTSLQSPNSKQIEQEVTAKDGPRETPSREGDKRETSNKPATSIISVYRSEFTGWRTLNHFVLASMCLCLHRCAFVLAQAHIYLCDLCIFLCTFTVLGYYTRCQWVSPDGSVSVVSTCSISVVNLGWYLPLLVYISKCVFTFVFLKQLLLSGQSCSGRPRRNSVWLMDGFSVYFIFRKLPTMHNKQVSWEKTKTILFRERLALMKRSLWAISGRQLKLHAASFVSIVCISPRGRSRSSPKWMVNG